MGWLKGFPTSLRLLPWATGFATGEWGRVPISSRMRTVLSHSPISFDSPTIRRPDEVDMARGKKRGGKKASINTTFTPAFGRGKGRGKKRR